MSVSIFEVMSRLARAHGAINLGQGFPDGNGPPDVVRAAADALSERSNQYPPMMGIPELRRAVAEHARRRYRLDVDWETQVLVTSGATEALAATFLSLLGPGDEAVALAPVYDSYAPMIRRAGATPRLVALEPPGWRLSRAALEAQLSPRTRMLVVNNPMNPCGRAFTEAELGCVRDVAVERDLTVVADEVYEHMVFDGRHHVPLSALPGMAERTVRIGSAGKAFSLTGWKVGYLTVPPRLLQTIARCHQFLVFTTPPNLQHAVAYGLGKDASYFVSLAAEMQAKRDAFAAELRAAGLAVLPCEGTYFLLADLGVDDDVTACRALTARAGVAAIPVSAFFDEGAPRHLARFCFAKDDAVLAAAGERLRAFLSRPDAAELLRQPVT